MAGAFTANGQGNITGGFLDLNDGSGESIGGNHRVIPQTIASGSVYTLGDDGQGTMKIVTNTGTYNFAMVLANASACAGNVSLSTCGHLIENDSAMPGSGVLKVQDATQFNVNFFPANLSFLYSGTDPAGLRFAGAGALGTNSVTQVDIDCSSSPGGNGWNMDGCPSDASYAAAPGLFNNVIKGTFSSTIDASTGRGDFVNLIFANDTRTNCQGPCNYAFYIVNKQEMILISSDPITRPANLTLWEMYRQQPASGGWTLSSLTGTNVVALNGVVPNGGSPLADISAGILTANGAGSATFNSDENKGGSLSQPQSPSGAYALDSADNGAASGKFDLNNFTQFGTGPAALYMVAPDQNSHTGYGFLIGSDADVTAGVLQQQSASSFSNSSVAGGYGGGTTSPVVAGATNSATYLFADGTGNINAIEATNGPAGPGSNALALTYSVDSTGRAVVQNNSQPYGVLYVVGSSKFVLVPDNTTPALNVFTNGPSN